MCAQTVFKSLPSQVGICGELCEGDLCNSASLTQEEKDAAKDGPAPFPYGDGAETRNKGWSCANWVLVMAARLLQQ